MSARENKQFITRYLAEVLSGQPKTKSLVKRFVADAELEEHIEFFEAAFPGYTLTAEDMVAEGDKVALRATFRGVHRGEFMGVPPTGKQVAIALMLIYRIADGKIVEHWMNADALSLMQQIGALPVPA